MRLINRLVTALHFARAGYTPANLAQELAEEAFLRDNGCTMQEAEDAQALALVNDHHRAQLGLSVELPF